jgi:hypothetical protein
MTLVQIVARGEEPDGYLDSAPLCPNCRCLRDSDWVSPTYRVRNRHDSVYSGGGVLLVSQRFIEAVREHAVGDVGCRFERLAADPQYFALVVDRVLEVDRAVGELEVGGGGSARCAADSRHTAGPSGSSHPLTTFADSPEATSSTAGSPRVPTRRRRIRRSMSMTTSAERSAHRRCARSDRSVGDR